MNDHVAEDNRRLLIQGKALLKKKRYEEASEKISSVLYRMPYLPIARFNYGIVLAAKEKYDEAILNMRCYMALAPDSPNIRKAQDRIYEWEALVL